MFNKVFVIIFLSLFSFIYADRFYSPLVNDSDFSETAVEGLYLYDIYSFSSYNTDFPHGMNDGLLWQGKGFNTIARAGLFYKWKYGYIKLLPEFSLSQNLSFDTLPPANSESNYGSIWSGIDNPQRMGDNILTYFTFGQSSVGFEYLNFELSISNENVKYGPVTRNPIMLSYNAPGYAKVNFNVKNLSTPIGTLGIYTNWGWTEESVDFDSNPDNDKTFISSMMITYNPVFLKNLTLGASRFVLGNGSEFDPAWILTILEIPGLVEVRGYGYDRQDQRFSIFGELNYPNVGFRGYFEWGRNDHASNLRRLVLIPDRTAAYSLGFDQKVGNNQEFTFTFEHSSLVASDDILIAGTGFPNFYSHHYSNHGQTNLGQILGAGIGSGSKSMYLSMDHEVNRENKWGIYIEHVNYDIDELLRNSDKYKEDDVDNIYNVLLSIGSSYYRLFDKLTLGIGYDFTINYNRNFKESGDVPNHYFWTSFKVTL